MNRPQQPAKASCLPTGPGAHRLGIGVAAAMIAGLSGISVARADAPCGELDECRVLIEINASDGDIGFHVLFDADGWKEARIDDPGARPIFKSQATASLRDQNATENFFESAEPVCELGLAEDPDDAVLTLPEFLQRFPAGAYAFWLKLADGGQIRGSTTLTHLIPPAPADVDFDGREISWGFGDDLGACTTLPPDFALAAEADLAGYEVVMSPVDAEWEAFHFAVQVPIGASSVTVPKEYLASLPANAALKVEVGAIERRVDGSFGNQTFSEADGFCNNVNQAACPDGD